MNQKVPLPPYAWIIRVGGLLDLKNGRITRITPRDFYSRGRDYIRFSRRFCKLQPNETVLDVGCGVGRLAVPLTEYLNENGRYEGFDIMPFTIKWAQKEVSSRYPNFHFRHVDVYNKEYNPKGNVAASKFKFPYKNDFFNFIILHSIFTHMLPPDVENYMSEISRVLKKGGRCLATWFLLNEHSLRLIKARKSILTMRFKVSSMCLSINAKTPESAVSYDEKYVRGLYRKNGLNIMEPIYYGAWSGRKKYLHIQDTVIANYSRNEPSLI